MRLKEAYFQIVGLGDIVIASDAMKKAYQQARQLHAERSVPVLIEGETGTGKELVARYIHYGEESVAESFVDLNCAALPSSIFESELFGYDAGAYTGGLPRGQKGKLDLAMGGTLFLDEITEVPLELQAKLLRVLQEKEFYRVGGLKKIKTDVRVICATNVDIEQKVEQERSGGDLFYRLNVARIYLPPLRERRDEIVPLAESFLAKFAKEKRKNFKIIKKTTADLLLSYQWPGNIRELRNLIEWAVLMHDDTELEPSHLRLIQKEDTKAENGAADQINFTLPLNNLPLKPFIDDIILKALEMHHDNKLQTARYLNIPTRTLYNHLRHFRK